MNVIFETADGLRCVENVEWLRPGEYPPYIRRSCSAGERTVTPYKTGVLDAPEFPTRTYRFAGKSETSELRVYKEAIQTNT